MPTDANFIDQEIKVKPIVKKPKKCYNYTVKTSEKKNQNNMENNIPSIILPQQAPSPDTSRGNEPAAPQQNPPSSPKKKIVIIAVVIAILAILGGLFYFLDLGKFFKGMMALPEGIPTPVFSNVEEAEGQIQGLQLVDGKGQLTAADQLFYKEFTPTTFDQSVEFWAKVESDGTIMKIKAKEGTDLFELSNSGGILVLKMGDSKTATSAENAVDGSKWQHFAFVVEAAEGVKAYIDGSEAILVPNGISEPVSSKIGHKLYASALNFDDPDTIFVATTEEGAGNEGTGPENPEVVDDPGTVSDPAPPVDDPNAPISDPAPAPISLTEIILFGGFTGQIDNVNIYDMPLTADQIKSIYESQKEQKTTAQEPPPPPCEFGPILYWPLKEGEEIDGTLTGTEWENGDLHFPNSATVTIPHNEKLNFGTNDMTISLWVKVKKMTSYANVISKSEGGYKSRKGFSYALSPTGWGGNSIFWFQDGDSSPYDPSKPEADSVASAQYSYIWNDTSVLKDKFTPNIDVTDGQWHNVVGVLDREEEAIRTYIDGKERSMPVRQVTGIGSIDATTDLIFGDEAFDGYIKNVAIFEKALTADEIKALYDKSQTAEYCTVEKQEIKNCTYEEKEYKPNEQFPKGDNCNSCMCKNNGTVECSSLQCKTETDVTTCKDGVALYWPLDKNTGVQVIDTVKEMKGNIKGAKWDENENALYFESGNKVEIPHNEAMNFDLSDLTLSTWVKIKNPTLNQAVVIAKREGSYKSRKGFSFELIDGWGGGSLFWFQDGNSTPYNPEKPEADSIASAQYAYIWDGKNTNYFKNIDPVKVLDGEWHNVVGTLNRTEGKIKVYIDGNERSIPFGGRTVTGIGSLDNSADLIFGGIDFNGYLKNIVIFKKALTAEEIDALYKETKDASYCTVEAGQISPQETHLSFEDAKNPGEDSSGNENDFLLKDSLNGGIATQSDDAIKGKSILLDGSADYMESTTKFSPNGTYMAWLKADTYTHCINEEEDGNCGIFNLSGQGSIRENTNKLQLIMDTGEKTKTSYTDAPILVSGKWQHVAVVMDKNVVYLYLNGELVKKDSNSFNETPLPIDKKSTLFIGEYFKGLMDEVRIFDKTLTEQEILAIYNEDLKKDEPGKAGDNVNSATTPASQPQQPAQQPVVSAPGGGGGGSSKKTVKAPKITPVSGVKTDGTGLLAEDAESLQMTCLTKDIQSLTYADVGDHWVTTYAKEVSKIKAGDKRILEGYIAEDGQRLLKPDDPITRAEFLKLALGMGCKCTQYTSKTKRFYDVTSDHWGYNIANCAEENEIAKGNADGGFNPDGAITRAEALALLLRAQGVKVETSTQASAFLDVKKTDWYHGVIKTGEGLKLISGYTDENGNKTFAPNNPITRAEAVSVIYKLL